MEIIKKKNTLIAIMHSSYPIQSCVCSHACISMYLQYLLTSPLSNCLHPYSELHCIRYSLIVLTEHFDSIHFCSCRIVEHCAERWSFKFANVHFSAFAKSEDFSAYKINGVKIPVTSGTSYEANAHHEESSSMNR
jgi:hypothetical protein